MVLAIISNIIIIIIVIDAYKIQDWRFFIAICNKYNAYSTFTPTASLLIIG